MVGPLVMRALGVALLCVVGPTFGAGVAIPAYGSEPATFDPNMPSYRFAEHVKREPGELAKLDKGIVAIKGAEYPKAIFALWDEFQAYATCSGGVTVICDVAYFDYAAGEIRTYVLPLAAATDWAYMTNLADPTSDANQRTPSIGPGIPALKNTGTPSSRFAHYLRQGPPKLREIEPGVIAVEVPQIDYPYSIYASGPTFEAYGGCARRVTVGCWTTFFDYKTGEIRDLLLDLDQAEELETYVNLIRQ